MFLKSFLPIIFFVLSSFTMITARGQAIAHFEFNSNATLTQNEVGPDALRINPNARSDGEGVYSMPAENNNIELVLPLSLFSASENIYMEFDFQIQEDYAWLISAGEFEWPADQREFFGIGYLHTEGFRVRYYTQANPNTKIDSEFIRAPGVPLDLNERAKISFMYDKEEGIAYLLKNGNEIWRTPPDEQTPGAPFLWFAKNDEITVASGMNGEGSTTPSLYSFKAYNGACGSITAPVVDDNDVEICGPGTATLRASGATEGNYRWYDEEDSAEPFDGAINSTFTTSPLNASSDNTFYVSHMQGPCESERIAVTVDVLPLPEAPVGINNGICDPGRVTIAATAAGAQDGDFRWYGSEGALQPIQGATSSTYTTEHLDDTKTYYVAIAGANGCESERIPVEAIINETPAPPTTENQKRCGPGKVTLTAIGGMEGNYRWYESMRATTSLPGSRSRNFETPEITTTTTYYVSVVNEFDENCESERVPITAEIVPLPDAPVAQDVPRCGPGSVTLSASGGTDGNYRWYTSDNPTTPIDGAVKGAFDTRALNTSTTYYVSIMDGDCESERTAVKAQILPLPEAPTVENGESCGPGQVRLTATADGAQDGDYRWYDSEGALQPIQGASSSTYTTDMLSATKAYYVAVVGDNGCESNRTKVEAIIHQMPPSALPQNLERCGPGEQSITIQTDGGDSTPPAIYKWYSQEEDMDPALETNSGTLLVSVHQDTTIYVSTSNGTCEGNKVAINVKVNPLPIIDAGEDKTILRGETVQLQAKGANGESIVCAWIANGSLDRTDIAAPMATPFISTQYIVTRTDDLTGCSNSDTVMVYVVDEFPVPNAFSPNNDGRNDLWQIPNIENYPDCVIKVFNNWGNKVYESKGYTTPWDGTLQGQEIPPGTYFYVLQLSREHKGIKGSLLLLR